MGFVYADITLKNLKDLNLAENSIIDEQKVRQKTVQAMVDTGARTLVINDALRQELGLELTEQKRATPANNDSIVCYYSEPARVHWKNRYSVLSPLVLPETSCVLLGAIPLEDMDLIVDPARQELTGAHGDEIVCII